MPRRTLLQRWTKKYEKYEEKYKPRCVDCGTPVMEDSQIWCKECQEGVVEIKPS